MKNKPIFSQIIAIIIISVICILLTVGIAFLAGSLNAELFDFKNLNFSNMIPILIIGFFISCVVVGICILFTAHAAFIKVKDYFEKTNEEKGEKEK